jgi:beta-glucanase (GH16 family)
MRQLMFLVAMALINSKCSNDENPTLQATTPTEEPVITIHPSADPDIPFTVVWEENFDGDTLDTDIWNFELGDGCDQGICGWGNQELQRYTDSNHYLSDGILTINIEKGNFYTSTRITTKGKKEFQYGKVEARMKLPQGDGLWPAFWMLGNDIDNAGWPDCGEIDIMEYVGRMPGIVHHSLHTRSSHGATINTKKVIVDNPEEEFHIYGMEWSSKAIDFYVDGELKYTYAPGTTNNDYWPFDKPFYFLLNAAVGGGFGGAVTTDEIFPQQFQIDYIKVYQRQP